jgi:redox-sensitive bicupin YhaK (pirin superfamily)
MTLGTGAEHSERNHSQTEPMRFLQLWILPARRGAELLAAEPAPPGWSGVFAQTSKL